MTEQRIDIEIQDKVSSKVGEKLRGIARDARDAGTAVQHLQKMISQINSSALSQLAAASAKVANAQARQVSAEARLINSNARMGVQAARTALAQQKLATETARTDAVNQKAAIGAAKVSLALTQQAAATARLQAAQARANNAQPANPALNPRNRNVPTGTRQANARSQNLFYQLNDIGVGLASGQKPLTVLIQQGSQIAGIYGTNGGIAAGLKQLRLDFARLVPPQLLIALAIAGSALIGLTYEIRKATGVQVTFGEVALATVQVFARSIKNLLIPAIKSIGPAFSLVYDGLKFVTRNIINITTAPFILVYDIIVTLFKHLPQALGEIFVGAFNLVLDVIEGIINKIIAGVNLITGPLNSAAQALGGKGDIKPISPVQLYTKKNNFNNTLGLVNGVNGAFDDATQTDRASKFASDVSKQAVKNHQDNQKDKAHKVSFADIREKAVNDIAELQQVGQARRVLTAILDAQEKLHRKLTASEAEELTILVKQKDIAQARSTILTEYVDAEENYASALAAANALLKEGLINEDQRNQSIDRAHLSVLELTRDLNGGLVGGLVRVRQEFTNVAELASNAVVNAFQGAEDALVSFVRTGKLDFKSLVDSIASDLARLSIRQSITAPLASLFGAASESGSVSGPGFGARLLAQLPSFDVGTDRVPRDMIAQIHEDEMVIPASEARAIRAGRGSSSANGGGGTQVISMGDIIINQSGSSNAAGNAEMVAMIGREVEKRQQQGMAEFTRQQQRVGGLLNSGNVVA